MRSPKGGIHRIGGLIAVSVFALLASVSGWCAYPASSAGYTAAPKGVPALSKDGSSVSWQGRQYMPIDDAGVYYYEADSVSGISMPAPRNALSSIVKRHGFHGMGRCELVDYVDCTRTDHGFVDEGRSRILTLADGDRYRVSAPGGDLSWFSYFLKTRPDPGRPHLIVVQTINDVERYTTVTLTVPKDEPWAPPYTGYETFEAKCQEPYPYHPDVGGCVYTGREYPLDGKSFNYIFPFYPKAKSVKVTVSHTAVEERYQDINGAAVARIWLFDILDPIADLAAEPVALDKGEERRIGLYIPHPWFMYSHYGIPSETKDQRLKSLKAFIDYMKFCGFNQLQFHVINGSDVAGCAWYDSKLYDNLQGNLLEEFIPLAAEAGIEVIPIVTPIMTPYRGNLGQIPDEPDENGFCKLSLQLDRDGNYANTMGCFAPDPLRPEVQEWLFKCFREILDRCAKYPNVPGIAFRVNGKIGLCYVGYEADRCGQDKGYSEWNISEFEKDTGIKVPRMTPTSYQWLRDNAWEQWMDWRCRRTRDFWLEARDLARSYRPDLKLVVACDLPSEYPGYNIEWVNGVPPRELMRHHGYDPELFRQDEGIIIQRGMMISSERHFGKWGPPHGVNAWAHKSFNYADGVVECYETPSGQAVEYYLNYWEESVHPDPQYGTWLRTATPAPPGQFYFEPASYSMRKANVHTMAFMGWERASIGHEHDLRLFSRAFRALPYEDPKDFDGRVEVLNVAKGAVYDKPEDSDVWVKWFGDRLAVVNDTGHRKYISLTIPRNLPKGSCLFDLGAQQVLVSAEDKALQQIELKLHLLEHDLHALAIMPLAQAMKLETAIPVPAESPDPGRLSLAVQGGKYAGEEAAITFSLRNTGKSALTKVDIDVEVPPEWRLLPSGESPSAPVNRTAASILPGKAADFSVRVRIPASEAGNVFWVKCVAVYECGGEAFSARRAVAVSPHSPVSLSVSPERISDKAAGEHAEFQVKIRNALSKPVNARLSYELTQGWEVSGGRETVELERDGSTSLSLAVRIPPDAKAGKHTLRVTAESADFSPVTVEAHLDVPIVLRKTSSPIQVDGDPSDWDDAAPDALVVSPSDFRAGNTDQRAPYDLAPTARVAWDDDFLYIACSIAGGEFTRKHSGRDIWQGDSLQIGIDSARDASAGGSGFSKIGFALTANGIEAWRWDAPEGKSKGPLESGTYSANADGQRQHYEAAIPWSELPPFEAKSGRTLGLAIVMNYDRGRGRDYVRWYHGIADGNDPSKFAVLMLR